jgi:hypothetical protein
MQVVALGCRVKSGRAVAVLIGGSRTAPLALARAELALSDPDDVSTRQPFHAAAGRLETDARRIASRSAAVRKSARRSVADTLAAWTAYGWTVRRAVLVAGSLGDPATIANQHIRAHASEGRLFRTALAEALGARHIRVDQVLEATLPRSAEQILEIGEQGLASRLAALGRTLGRPWQADHKHAALAAWTLLS